MKRAYCLLSAVALLLASCDENTPISARPVPVLEALAAEASATSADVGEVVIFTATGTLHQAATPETTFEEDMTALVLWESSAPGVILPSPDGRAEAKSAGTATITATTPMIPSMAAADEPLRWGRERMLNFVTAKT